MRILTAVMVVLLVVLCASVFTSVRSAVNSRVLAIELSKAAQAVKMNYGVRIKYAGKMYYNVYADSNGNLFTTQDNGELKPLEVAR